MLNSEQIQALATQLECVATHYLMMADILRGDDTVQVFSEEEEYDEWEEGYDDEDEDEEESVEVFNTAPQVFARQTTESVNVFSNNEPNVNVFGTPSVFPG